MYLLWGAFLLSPLFVIAIPLALAQPEKIYNIAGFGTSGLTNTNRIYDIPTNTWTTGAPLPTVLSDHATAYSNGKIYVAAGYNGSLPVNTLYIYDITSNSWTTGAPMPAALYLTGFGVINGKLYIASGNNGLTEVNTLYIYDIASNTWSTGATVPTPVTGPGSAVYQGKLYLFGGGAPFPATITATQIYDPGTNSWSSGPAMNVARLWFYGGAVDNTSIVAPGGEETSAGTPINDNEQLTASWAIKAPVPYAARGPFAVSDGTFVYIGGGYDGSTAHTDLLRYDPVVNTYTPLAPSGDAHFLSQAVIVTPCTSPVIQSIAATPSSIWPPNKRMVPVAVTIQATATCGIASEKIISISSNQPSSGEYQITGDLTVNLLADRNGTGTGRVYTITVQVGDPSNNTATGTVTVTVPHDQGK